LDYFPGSTTVIASFLVIKKVDPSAPSPDATGTTTGKTKRKKIKSHATSTPATDTPNDTPPSTPTPQEQPQSQTVSDKPAATSSAVGPTDTTTSPKSKIKEYYQPVTMRLHANNPRTLEPLARVVKPPNEVRKYMNDIMDRMERAEICYLALRLPRDGAELGTYGGTDGEGVAEEARAGRSGRRGRGRSKSKAGEMGAENRMAVKLEGDGEDDGENEEEEVEEELKDFYDAPSAIVPRCNSGHCL
jgi:hypothetical protein